MGPDPRDAREPKLTPLKAMVGTAGKEKMAWWIGSYNKTIGGLQVAKTEDALVIAFDIDTEAWNKCAVTECF
ncbi:MAG: hypothetical protein C0501_31215, partial [Isosphaera sp.]|nr:hypothetical protein [Isosphaera sp.]